MRRLVRIVRSFDRDTNPTVYGVNVMALHTRQSKKQCEERKSINERKNIQTASAQESGGRAYSGTDRNSGAGQCDGG